MFDDFTASLGLLDRGSLTGRIWLIWFAWHASPHARYIEHNCLLKPYQAAPAVRHTSTAMHMNNVLRSEVEAFHPIQAVRLETSFIRGFIKTAVNTIHSDCEEKEKLAWRSHALSLNLRWEVECGV